MDQVISKYMISSKVVKYSAIVIISLFFGAFITYVTPNNVITNAPLDSNNTDV